MSNPVKQIVDSAGNVLSIVDYEARNIIAPAYNTNKTYTVGEYCIYNNKMYKCITSVDTPGSFNPNSWLETTNSDELSGLTSSLANSFKIINTAPINVTTNQNGYASITPPTTPTGYTLLATAVHYWSTMTTPSAITIDAPGTYVLSSANNTIQGLRVRYIYVETSQVSS